MKQQQIVKYWRVSADKDFAAAEVLFKSGSYSHALFFCHLSIEKMLKAIIVKRTNSAPPFVHDLVRLAEKSGIALEDKIKIDLAEISTFNVAARYDDYKLQFAKKATKAFTLKYRQPLKIGRFSAEKRSLIFWNDKAGESTDFFQSYS